MNIFLFIALFFLSFPAHADANHTTTENNSVTIQKSEGGSSAEVHLSTGTVEGSGEVRVEQKAEVSVNGEEIHVTKVITQTSGDDDTTETKPSITITKSLTPPAGGSPKPTSTHSNEAKKMLEEKSKHDNEESFTAQILRFIRSLFHKL